MAVKTEHDIGTVNRISGVLEDWSKEDNLCCIIQSVRETDDDVTNKSRLIAVLLQDDPEYIARGEAALTGRQKQYVEQLLNHLKTGESFLPELLQYEREQFTESLRGLSEVEILGRYLQAYCAIQQTRQEIFDTLFGRVIGYSENTTSSSQPIRGYRAVSEPAIILANWLVCYKHKNDYGYLQLFQRQANVPN